jgi:hypothetical protein
MSSGTRLVPRLAALAVLGLLFTVQVFSGGKRQIDTQTADGIKIWQKEFDVSGLKPGKYNVIIQARDAAGNVGVSGPFNLRVDPNAGLPVARVVYPENNAVIRGDINLIGVASGRYGLKQVQIRLDDGEYRPVEGIEYWSREIQIRNLSEGRHAVYAQALDSKGMAGPEYGVNFVIDKSPPAIELSSHRIGDFISGNITLEGRADDPNGIDSVAWSSDGETWQPLLLKTKRGETGAFFSFPVRTRNRDDGPAVCYIRAADKTGFTLTKPYLFFIDNKGPELEILSPGRDEDVYEQVQVTGRVIDTVGLDRFYYEWAGETGDIPLRPGDPFWTLTFPVSMATNRALPFRVTAVDKSGNETTAVQRFQDTRRIKTPTLIIDYPSQADLGSLPQDGFIYGHIAPGFFPAAVIMEGQIENIPAGPAFRIPPEFIPQGRSVIKLWAMDRDDTLGAAVNIRVNKPAPQVPRGQEPPPPPDLSLSPVTVTSPERYSYLGNSFVLEGNVGVQGGVRLEYRLSPADDWKSISVNGDGSFSGSIGLGAVEEGPVHLELRVIQGGLEKLPVYHPVNKSSTAARIEFLTPSRDFGSIHGNVTVSGTVSYFVPLTEIAYSLDGAEFVPLQFIAKYGKAWFSYLCDFSALSAAGGNLIIRAVDVSGRVVTASPDIVFDGSTDLPVPIVNSPNDGEVVTDDFEISGIAFDDDGVAAVYWRIMAPANPGDSAELTAAAKAETEFRRIETAQSFEVLVPFDEVVDGENIIEVYGEDIYGVKGEVIRRVIKVSSLPPATTVTVPAIDIYNRKNIYIRGVSHDANGIRDVLVSMDNGNSYQSAGISAPAAGAANTAAGAENAEGGEEWSLSLNTLDYTDGVYSALIRTFDNYGIESFSNALINIDNSPPDISLGAPGNGSSAGTVLSVSGQVNDNIGVHGLSLQLVNIADARQILEMEMQNDFVIMEDVDISPLPDGEYNLKINAVDLAGNEAAVTRDIVIAKDKQASEVAIVNPMPGTDHSGPVFISGRVTGAVIPKQINLLVNRELFSIAEVDRYGVFYYEFPEERLRDGTMLIQAAYNSPGGDTISSFENEINLSRYGPRITVESHRDGDVITQRPWLSGAAGLTLSPEEAETLSRRELASFAVKEVLVSFDNGRSFDKAQGTDKWKYRLETGDLAAGPLPILLKAVFADGRTALRRIILTVDTSPPRVHTIGPVENSSHRDSVLVYGSSEDNFDMDTVEISFRPGDKAGYSVPQFIQGLYFDGSMFGATYGDFGLGLSFFENNVKLQAQIGLAPPGRFSGLVAGFKLLANLYVLPFGYYLGPDWEFLSMSFALGANFSYFGMEEDETPLVMGAVLAQWEFVRADLSYFFPKWKYFKTLSLYTEPIFWFASSDVSAGAIFRCTLGMRISLF